MRKAIKGALWSGLIWPGVGQIVLKRPGRGMMLVLATTVILALIAVKAARIALAMMDQMARSGQSLDMASIYHVATRAVAGSGGLSFNLLGLLLIACWIVSIVDAYSIGRRLDNRS